MTKKLYILITSITGAVATAASAIVTYCQPSYAAGIVAAIGIGSTAIAEILNLFVKTDSSK